MSENAITSLFVALCFAINTFTTQAQSFVTVEGGRFMRNGREYNFLGTNFWYGMNLGYADPDRLVIELDSLQRLGINNLRVMAASEGAADAPWCMHPAVQTLPGVYDENLLVGLDRLLDEMRKRDMVAVMCLNNFWQWSGGMAQYVSWANGGEAVPYPTPTGGDWDLYRRYTAQFYTSQGAITLYNQYLHHLIDRSNTVNGLVYKNDPTIMAWQLANEPEGINQSKAYRQWINATGRLIKQADPNHLVSIGSEGNTADPKVGNDFKLDHQSKYIDYCTMHIWIQNWSWYDPLHPEESLPAAEAKALAYLKEHLKVAHALNKPMVLEEFGIARDDNSYVATAPVTYRDRYYRFIFEHVATLIAADEHLSGVNFWAWGGLGRPREPMAIWKTGDDFIGDPPHEYQGWYSVYNTDQSTLDLIRHFAARIAAGGEPVK